MYYLILPNKIKRDLFISRLKNKNIGAVFHYVPLHDSYMGKQYGRVCGSLGNTNHYSDRLVRLPMWLGLEGQQNSVIQQIIIATR